MRQIQLSPSDFAYLYEKCPRCWWLKTRRLAPLNEPFPQVFNSIDKAMKMALKEPSCHPALARVGLKVKRAIELPGRLVSAPIEYPEHGVSITIAGYLDQVFEAPDGYTIIDYKTTHTMNEVVLAKYSAQLHAYAWCIEHPKEAKPHEIAGLGVLAFSPTGMKLKIPECALVGGLVYTPMPVDRHSFTEQYLNEAARIAGLDEMPMSGPSCFRCFAVNEAIQYHQQRQERLGKKQPEILDLVRQVRDAQRAYFRDRSQTNLIESKRLEKILDDMITEGATQ